MLQTILEGPCRYSNTCHTVPAPAGQQCAAFCSCCTRGGGSGCWAAALHLCVSSAAFLSTLSPNSSQLLSFQALSFFATQVVQKELIYDGATLTLKPKIAYMQDKVAQRHDKPNSPFQAEGPEQVSCWNALL